MGGRGAHCTALRVLRHTALCCALHYIACVVPRCTARCCAVLYTALCVLCYTAQCGAPLCSVRDVLYCTVRVALLRSNFGRKQCIFGEQSGRRNPPLLFWGCIIKKKAFLWSFWVQNLVSWFFCAYTILYRYTGVQHCSAAPPRSRQKYSKIGRIPGFLMVWEEARVGGTPPSLSRGQRIQRKLEFLSKILYRQVHWCAALFCRISPKQAKIPQSRPNFRVFDIFGQNSGRRTPPPILGPEKSKN